MSKKIGFVFPGQGSQKIKMLADLYEPFPIIKKLFGKASEVLGYDLWQLTQEGPEEKLNQTEFTQPALLVADVAIWHCWNEKNGIKPLIMAGHSLGEYAALVCANSLSFEEGVQLVAKRGAYMQAAVQSGIGAMAAIVGLEDEQVTELCDQMVNEGKGLVSPANFNSIGQIVVAGHTAAVDALVSLAKEKGARLARRIPVSVPSHCALMAPAAQRLATALKTVAFKTPEIPVIQNANVDVSEDPEIIRTNLIEQLIRPVQWVKTILKMKEDGIAVLIESGPSHVLAGLNKRILAEIPTYSVSSVESLASALQSVGELGCCQTK